MQGVRRSGWPGALGELSLVVSAPTYRYRYPYMGALPSQVFRCCFGRVTVNVLWERSHNPPFPIIRSGEEAN